MAVLVPLTPAFQRFPARLQKPQSFPASILKSKLYSMALSASYVLTRSHSFQILTRHTLLKPLISGVSWLPDLANISTSRELAAFGFVRTSARLALFSLRCFDLFNLVVNSNSPHRSLFRRGEARTTLTYIALVRNLLSLRTSISTFHSLTATPDWYPSLNSALGG